MNACNIACAVMLGSISQQKRNPTARELRGVAIAATFDLRRNGDEWAVPSQSKNCEYRIRKGVCTCKDKNEHCKHLLAVDLLANYARELVRRLGREDKWNGTVEDAKQLHDEYVLLCESAEKYTPPADSMLYAFRLEAIGDDAYQRQRQANRCGQVYMPSRLRDMHPDRPWISAINGLCPQYEFRRGFLRGRVDYREADKRGSRGIYLYFSLPPGLYEVYEKESHSESRRYFARVADLKMLEIDKREVVEWLAGKRS